MSAIWDKVLDLAKKSLDEGNFPVGAILLIDGEIIAEGRNTAEKNKNYSLHAETSMLISNAEILLEAWKKGKEIELYSSLEPCLMCLGVAVMNKISKIVYLQDDPLAGACKIDTQNLGVRYRDKFPTIVKKDYGSTSKGLIISFLDKQIENDVRKEWSLNFKNLLLKN